MTDRKVDVIPMSSAPRRQSQNYHKQQTAARAFWQLGILLRLDVTAEGAFSGRKQTCTQSSKKRGKVFLIQAIVEGDADGDNQTGSGAAAFGLPRCSSGITSR
jgi:hypothetical protein